MGVEHQRGVHPWLARHPPRAFDADVGGKIRGREKVFGQHSVGGRGNEGRVRSVGQLGQIEIGVSEDRHTIKLARYRSATGSLSSVTLSCAVFGMSNRSMK